MKKNDPAETDPSINPHRPDVLSGGQALRRQAEAKWSEFKKKTGPLPAVDADIRRLMHELEVHQIELEMQNEELVRSRAESEAAQRQFEDLYDFAPVGYFTLARDGAIRQVNLAGADLLGMERGALLKRRFGVFVSAESRPAFDAFLGNVFSKHGSKETCEVVLQKDGSVPRWVYIEAAKEVERREVCQVIVMDITERVRVQEEIQNLARFPSENPNPILRIARDGTLLYCNEAGLSLLSQLHLQVGQSSPPILRKAVLQSMNSNVAQMLDLEYGERVYSFHIAPVGAAGYANLYGRDITERVRAEDVLRENESLLRTMAHSYPNSYISIIEKDLTIGFTSGQEFKKQNLDPGQFVGLKLKQVFGEQTPLVRQYYLKTFGGAETQFELFINDQYQIYRTVPLFDQGGKVNRILVVVENVTERKKYEEELRYLGTHDMLTGLYNRNFFIEEMARLERGREFPVSIVMADVDQLKATNDNDGHAAGDALLKRVAQALTAAFRAEDVVARIGGDEFAVLLPNTDATAAEETLRRVRQMIRENNAANTKAPIRLSIGVSTAQNPKPLADVLKEADDYMYHEKRGRNEQ